MSGYAEPIVLPRLEWRSSPNASSRGTVRPNLVVWHESAGSYAGDVSWLCNPKSRASAHLVLREDAREATQLVRYGEKAWTQADFNPRALSLEISTRARQGFSTASQILVGARIVAWLLWKYDLPPRYARRGVGAGFTRHLELGTAGGGHTQCGPDDDVWAIVVELIEREYHRGDFRRSWGKE